LSDFVARASAHAHFGGSKSRGTKMKTNSPKASSNFYTINQIAKFVEVSSRTVRRWIQGGLLVAHRINGLVRISEADFQAFLATHREP
jgi:excisionase family DNA binding protein